MPLNLFGDRDRHKGTESVWDYPRPPRVESSDREVSVELGGVMIAHSNRTKRVLETSHAPAFYFPREDVHTEYLWPSERRSVCEYKGVAHYFTVTVEGSSVQDAAWSYPAPRAGYEIIADHIAFYPALMDACYVDGEKVRAQAGDFHGGWITKDILGPFKGGRGTESW